MLRTSLLSPLHASLRRSSSSSSSSTIAASSSRLAQLRASTGHKLSLCRNALLNCDSDLSRAKQWLDERMMSKMKSGEELYIPRARNNCLFSLTKINNCLLRLNLNSDTDFVAKSVEFRNTLHRILDVLLEDSKQSSGDDDLANRLEKYRQHLPESVKCLLTQCVERFSEQINLGVNFYKLPEEPEINGELQNYQHSIYGYSSAQQTQFAYNDFRSVSGNIVTFIQSNGFLQEDNLRYLCQNLSILRPKDLPTFLKSPHVFESVDPAARNIGEYIKNCNKDAKIITALVCLPGKDDLLLRVT
ncbi:MAG: hypothetical protein MHMPM18_001303 [Marteilia pararefringens]